MDALLLTRQEAAALLCISVRALDRLKAEERIAWVAVGRSVRFRPEALAAWAKANERNGVASQPSLPRVAPAAQASTFDLAALERSIPARRRASRPA